MDRGDSRASFAVIPGVVRGDTRHRSRWNFARLGICTPCKLKNPISFWFLGFCGFYAACAEKVGQIDLFYGTDTHYDKNCWVYREALWLSARSPSEYAGKRLKMAVSKRLANHHRAAGKISVLYAHARGSYSGWARTHVNNLERRKFVVARGNGMAGLSRMPEQTLRRRKSGRPHDLPDFLLFIRKHLLSKFWLRSAHLFLLDVLPTARLLF